MSTQDPISNIQLASAISRSGEALTMTNSFTEQQIIYLTFDVINKEREEESVNEEHQTAWIKADWYKADVLYKETFLAIQRGTQYGYICLKYAKERDGKVCVYSCEDQQYTHPRLISTLHFEVH